jgi:hypothetical protein
VRLKEAESGVDASGDSNESQWPEEDFADLEPRDPRGPLTIRIVPVQYEADGSGRLPDTSDAQLGRIRDAFMQRYPVPEVEVSVAPPLVWNSSVQPTGQGWNTLLDAILAERWGDGPSEDVYYYGMFSPALSLANYCSSGCIAGLSPLAQNPSDSWARASIGLGFPGESSAWTMVHEIGHAHGREHAPCGLFGQPSDNNFPNSTASIGVWGYDILGLSLRDPDDYTDFMAYCDPTWVSDYTYDQLFERVQAVNNLNSFLAGPDHVANWLVASVAGDGTARRSGRLQLLMQPGGLEQTLTLLDSSGRAVGETSAYFSGLNHLPGGHLLFPEPGPKVAAVLLTDGTTLEL